MYYLRIASKEDFWKIGKLENDFQEPNFILSEVEDVEKCLANGHSMIAVHPRTKEIVAFCLIAITEYGTAYIEKVFVHPEARGFQLQAKLVNAIFDNIKECNNVKICYTMASPDNEVSLHNFKKCGFVEKWRKEYKGQQRIVLAYEVNN